MRILIADDHDLVRETLSAFLTNEGEFEVVLAEDLPSAKDRIAEDGPYDLVLLDYGMPGMNGLDGLGEAQAANGGKPVALMSGIAPKEIAQKAVDQGAAGFLPKTIAAKSLVNAVRFMCMGETYIPHDFLTREEEEVAKHPLAAKMSERELQVLGGLCRGLSNKEIARELDLQEVTVKLHVKTLSRKLEARNRTHAAMIGKEAGLV
ncbi:response regulator transcription factor [Pontivivens insulae]|uniref:Response regulator protein VraR n=1 Tax=Pontivivens insulae TaxID=1639689 RepID=A0A2R8A6V1_9RHOB|nr:response regulator transcription factor [Pontivivens insulae]RED18076.1 LuxR family two component transcriptional regulator [Pontivivens insulae]SPF27973.1 Response regulator protein VraR [Pontivivens insulae]